MYDSLKDERGFGYIGEIAATRTPTQTNEVLDRVLKRAEEGITTLDSYSGITKTAENLGMTRQSFLSLIQGRRLCDIGSGIGGLAMECILEEVQTEITSVNPAIAHSRFRADQLSVIYGHLRNKYSEGKIQAAFATYERQAYAAISDELPFANDMFDLVIDNRAVSFYSAKLGEERYKKSVREMVRILKPGGSLLIGDAVHFLDTQKLGHQMTAIKELNLPYEYTYALNQDIKYNFPIGVNVIKL